MKSTISGIFLFALFGCASIVSNSSYPVTIHSNPSGAQITVSEAGGRIIHQGTSPAKITLDAGDGYFGSAAYVVEASLPGYPTRRMEVSASLDGWYFGNLLFGGLIGFFIVDPLTGAMWCLDESVVVELGDKLSSGSGQESSGLHILSLADVPAEYRDRMIRLD